MPRLVRIITPDEEAAAPGYPRELKDAAVAPEDLTKDMHAREHLALDLVFGDNYAKYKKNIYAALDRSLTGAAKLSDNRRIEATRRQNLLWINQFVSVSLFVLSFLILLTWAERLFSRRMAFLQQMLDFIPLLIYLKNRKTKCYMDSNLAFSDYLQHSGIEDPKGKTNYDLLPADKAHELEKNDEEAMEKGEPTVHYESMPGPLGQSRYFRTTRLGIKDAEGNPCMLAMALDMTEDHERQLNSEATEEALIALQQEPTLVSPLKMLAVLAAQNFAWPAAFCSIAL